MNAGAFLTDPSGQLQFRGLLAAWGYALEKYGKNDAKARAFVTQMYKNVLVLNSGARGATTTFIERGMGDALAGLGKRSLSRGQVTGSG